LDSVAPPGIEDARRAKHSLFYASMRCSRELRWVIWAGRADDIGQSDAVIFAPDMREPVADIAAQDERIIRGLVRRASAGDEFEKGDRGDIDLFIGHFVQLGDASE